MSFTVPLRPVENVDNGESNSQGVALLITNQNGEKVYRWSHDKGFLTVIVDAKLRKYERLSFSESGTTRIMKATEFYQGNTPLP